MTHIFLPQITIGYYEKRFPHKHADTAVKDLIDQMTKEGAFVENMSACVIGGMVMYKNVYNDMGTRNTEAVKKELQSFNIRIVKEFTGRNKGSTIIYNVRDSNIYLPNFDLRINF